MKKWFILIGVIAIFLVGGYFSLSYYAVKFVQARLQKVTGPGFAIAEISAKSTYLAAKGIRYEDSGLKRETAFIEEMRIYPSFLSLWKRTLSIREWRIIRPSFYFHRTQGGDFVGPWIVLGKEKEKGGPFVTKKEEEKEPVRVKIDRLRILKGKSISKTKKLESLGEFSG